MKKGFNVTKIVTTTTTVTTTVTTTEGTMNDAGLITVHQHKNNSMLMYFSKKALEILFSREEEKRKKFQEISICTKNDTISLKRVGLDSKNPHKISANSTSFTSINWEKLIGTYAIENNPDLDVYELVPVISVLKKKK